MHTKSKYPGFRITLVLMSSFFLLLAFFSLGTEYMRLAGMMAGLGVVTRMIAYVLPDRIIAALLGDRATQTNQSTDGIL